MHAKKQGFTLLELMLVVSIVALLAGIVIAAVNPAQQFRNMRNAQRRADVNTILNATFQYIADHNGLLPDGVQEWEDCAAEQANICLPGHDCSGITDISTFVGDSRYFLEMPADPKNERYGASGYHMAKNANGFITVCAPLAEGTVISVTK